MIIALKEGSEPVSKTMPRPGKKRRNKDDNIHKSSEAQKIKGHMDMEISRTFNDLLKSMIEIYWRKLHTGCSLV